jgi:hypothetical protein
LVAILPLRAANHGYGISIARALYDDDDCAAVDDSILAAQKLALILRLEEISIFLPIKSPIVAEEHFG